MNRLSMIVLLSMTGIPAPAAAKQWTEATLLAQFAHEPTVQQVQEAGVRYYQVHPHHIRSMRRNAQLKALVPTISGEFSNYVTSAKRNLADGLYPTIGSKEYEQTNGDSMGFRVQASWALDRLVFNAEVLDVQSLIGILDGVVREVTTIYYIRRRLQIDMVLRPPTDLATRISQRIRIEELTGLLDAMTGNYMTKMIDKATRNTKQAKVRASRRAAQLLLRQRATN